jgi:hypothetical protein
VLCLFSDGSGKCTSSRAGSAVFSNLYKGR